MYVDLRVLLRNDEELLVNARNNTITELQCELGNVQTTLESVQECTLEGNEMSTIINILSKRKHEIKQQMHDIIDAM